MKLTSWYHKLTFLKLNLAFLVLTFYVQNVSANCHISDTGGATGAAYCSEISPSDAMDGILNGF